MAAVTVEYARHLQVLAVLVDHKQSTMLVMIFYEPSKNRRITAEFCGGCRPYPSGNTRRNLFGAGDSSSFDAQSGRNRRLRQTGPLFVI